MSVNKVILLGNLGADPEAKSTAGGTMVAHLRVATSERVKDRGSDTYSDHTEWHRVVCFGKTAENVVEYLRKGRQVYIEGKIRTQKWQDKDGQDRYTTEVIADTVQFIGGAKSDGDNDRPARNGGGKRSGNKPDDDLPF